MTRQKLARKNCRERRMSWHWIRVKPSSLRKLGLMEGISQEFSYGCKNDRSGCNHSYNLIRGMNPLLLCSAFAQLLIMVTETSHRWDLSVHKPLKVISTWSWETLHRTQHFWRIKLLILNPTHHWSKWEVPCQLTPIALLKWSWREQWLQNSKTQSKRSKMMKMQP